MKFIALSLLLFNTANAETIPPRAGCILPVEQMTSIGNAVPKEMATQLSLNTNAQVVARHRDYFVIQNLVPVVLDDEKNTIAGWEWDGCSLVKRDNNVYSVLGSPVIIYEDYRGIISSRTWRGLITSHVKRLRREFPGKGVLEKIIGNDQHCRELTSGLLDSLERQGLRVRCETSDNGSTLPLSNRLVD